MTTPNEEIPFVIQEFLEEARALEKTMVQVTWYMRGGVTLDQAYKMTPRQRKHALKLIKENIERTNKTGTNFL